MRKEQLNCKSHQFNCSLRAYSALYNTTTGDMSGHNNIECVTWCVSNWNKEKSPRKSESSALGEVISTAPESSVMGDMSADPCFLRDLDVYKYSIWLWTDNKSNQHFCSNVSRLMLRRCFSLSCTWLNCKQEPGSWSYRLPEKCNVCKYAEGEGPFFSKAFFFLFHKGTLTNKLTSFLDHIQSQFCNITQWAIMSVHCISTLLKLS